MDSNDRERANEARDELSKMARSPKAWTPSQSHCLAQLEEDELRDAVVLVFANKQA